MFKKSSERFFVIMASVTFIIMVTGATFAYFTATAKSEEAAVNTSSHFVQVAYNEGRVMSATDLIPAVEEVAMFGYHSVKLNNATGEFSYTDNSQCVDDNNYHVCSTYSFEVTNLGSLEQHMGAFVSINSNYFTNLKYVLYDVTDVLDTDSVEDKYKKRVEVSRGDLPTTYTGGGSFQPVAPVYIVGAEGQLSQVVGSNETKKYEIVLWLNETGGPQEEQLFTFAGKVTVSLTDEEHIYGYIEKVDIE